ncbi:hypothetical protein MP228_000618 [Amoeboaphelidium protococcarum]|nr:hypothetical protein MP228_000618 [Amoeboaphelidium protococcarum]
MFGASFVIWLILHLCLYRLYKSILVPILENGVSGKDLDKDQGEAQDNVHSRESSINRPLPPIPQPKPQITLKMLSHVQATSPLIQTVLKSKFHSMLSPSLISNQSLAERLRENLNREFAMMGPKNKIFKSLSVGKLQVGGVDSVPILRNFQVLRQYICSSSDGGVKASSSNDAIATSLDQQQSQNRSNNNNKNNNNKLSFPQEELVTEIVGKLVYCGGFYMEFNTTLQMYTTIEAVLKVHVLDVIGMFIFSFGSRLEYDAETDQYIPVFTVTISLKEDPAINLDIKSELGQLQDLSIVKQVINSTIKVVLRRLFVEPSGRRFEWRPYTAGWKSVELSKADKQQILDQKKKRNAAIQQQQQQIAQQQQQQQSQQQQAQSQSQMQLSSSQSSSPTSVNAKQQGSNQYTPAPVLPPRQLSKSFVNNLQDQ